MADIEDFLRLIPPEHRDKSKFVATVKLWLQPFVDNINLLDSLPGLFDLDTAVGQQLDFVGQWVGLTRYINEPLDVFFSFDIEGLGFDEGVWYQGTWAYVVTFTEEPLDIYFSFDVQDYDLVPNDVYLSFDTYGLGFDEGEWYEQGDPTFKKVPNGTHRNLGWDQGEWYEDGDPLTRQVGTSTAIPIGGAGGGGVGLVALDDAAYRILLKARAVANQWDGSIPGAYRAWNTLFNPEGYQILIQDGEPQPMSYFAFDDPVNGFDEVGWEPAIPGVVSGNMTMTLALIGPPLDAVIRALFTTGLLGLKPAGVGVDYYVTQSVPGAPLFGFDADDTSVGGFDHGGWGLLTPGG